MFKDLKDKINKINLKDDEKVWWMEVCGGCACNRERRFREFVNKLSKETKDTLGI